MRFALVGFGAIGQFRVKALQQTPGAELALVVDCDASRLAQAKALAGVDLAESIDAIVSRNDIDVAIVSTPPHVHRDATVALLKAGKHVLVEKPLASDLDDCRSMVEAAKAADRVLGTGYNYRFYEAIAKARELIQSGAIGQLDYIRSFAGHPGGPEFTHPWVHDTSIMGGGALMDNGTHVIDLTLHFLGGYTQVSGFATEHTWKFPGSEDNGFLLMCNESQNVATVHASWTEWKGYQFRVEIYGTEGCVTVSYPPMLTVWHRRPVGKAKRGKRRVFLFPGFQLQERLRSYRWTIVQSFIREQLDFMARVRGENAVGATGAEGMQAVEAAFSAYGGKPNTGEGKLVTTVPASVS